MKHISQSGNQGQFSFYLCRSLLKINNIHISGLSGLYRGISTNIASSAPISAVYTFTYESVKGALLPLLREVGISLSYSSSLVFFLFFLSLLFVFPFQIFLGSLLLLSPSPSRSLEYAEEVNIM